MSDQPLNGIRDNEPLPHHQALPDSMIRGRRGWRRLLLLINNRWACPLLGRMAILGVALPFLCNSRAHPTPPPTACTWQQTSSPMPSAYQRLSLKKLIEKVRKIRDGLKNEWTWISQQQGKVCNWRAISVGSRPPQNAWKVSRVTKSFHFLCSKGISKTCLMKPSYSSLIYGRAWARNEKVLDTKQK